jgi:hypothetical protein
MSIVEIESAITQLPPQEVAELMAWLQIYHEQTWDKQIEGDLEAGRLDSLLADVEHDCCCHNCPT